MIIRPAGPLGPTWAPASTDYDAQRAMLEDLATAMRPFLRDQLPSSCRPVVAVTEPPNPLAMVVHLGVEELPVVLEARLMQVMDAVKKVQERAFPTLPLVLEVLKPPLNKYGFVAHLGENAPPPVYPRFVTAKAVARLRRGALKGAVPWQP